MKKAIALSPRDEWHSVNLASVYLRLQEFDQAAPILQQLQQSTSPQIAAMAAQELGVLENYRNAVARSNEARAQAQNASSELRLAKRNDDDDKAPEEPPAPKITVKPEPIIFMKGTLVSVDCSGGPSATLTISSAGKTWKLLAPDTKKLILSGADEFSCAWTRRKVAVNYRLSGTNEGKLVTLELE